MTERLVPCVVHLDQEGAHLCCDTVHRVFAHRAKLVGDGFGERNNEHETSAKAKTTLPFFHHVFSPIPLARIFENLYSGPPVDAL